MRELSIDQVLWNLEEWRRQHLTLFVSAEDESKITEALAQFPFSNCSVRVSPIVDLGQVIGIRFPVPGEEVRHVREGPAHPPVLAAGEVRHLRA